MSEPETTAAMLDKLKEIIMRENMPQDAEDITPATRITEDMGFDSLDRIELAMAIEEHFFDGGDVIGDETVNGWATVGDVLQYLEKNVRDAKAKK